MQHRFRAYPVALVGLMAAGLAWAGAPRPHAFAQKLVDQLQAAHPEFSEIGISAIIAGSGCQGIASTDKSDIGEKCEADDAAPIRTGRESIGSEGKNLDISLPVHDASGKLVGAVGIETAPGADREATLRKVRAAVHAMEKQISSHAQLIS